MSGYKHYIRINEAGIVVHGFSTAFEQAQPGDLQLAGELGRHFQIQLTNERGQYKYKVVNGQMVERTQEELDVEWEAKPAPAPSQEDRIKAVEDLLLDMMLGGF